MPSVGSGSEHVRVEEGVDVNQTTCRQFDLPQHVSVKEIKSVRRAELQQQQMLSLHLLYYLSFAGVCGGSSPSDSSLL